MALGTLSNYEAHVANFKEREYPSLMATTYLDHAGMTPYAKSLIERFSADMLANLYGNPHSASRASDFTRRQVEDIRHSVLRFLNADPADFDVIFVANATYGIKLVMEAFRDNADGFWYGYHKDSHTSLVGVREAAQVGRRCFMSDSEVENWLNNAGLGTILDEPHQLRLFAYPAQSNMNGRRLPLDWCSRIRRCSNRSVRQTYSLLDAAAYASTSPINLSDAGSAPDFTVLSFHKIFGFPDLGALIVKKDAANVLLGRAYFGGGTVDMVVCLKEEWHAKKSNSIHDALEDGTLPIHSIIALRSAIDVHKELFGTLEHISKHTSQLVKRLHDGLLSLKHGNDTQVCQIYKDRSSIYGDASTQGPVVAFNMCSSKGAWISNTEVEKLAGIRNIQLRSGGLCNPGGIASSLNLEPWELKQKFSAGYRCGSEDDVVDGKPTGVLRASLGAMSTAEDVDRFLAFLQEFFVEGEADTMGFPPPSPMQSIGRGDLFVESLAIYPIKSCGEWRIPAGWKWSVHAEGLAWDREWFIVHRSTGATLSQKQYPKMTLIRPSIDLTNGLLRIRYDGHQEPPSCSRQEIIVPLSADPRSFEDEEAINWKLQASVVCGDAISARVYTSVAIEEFLYSALGVPCQLARFPPSADFHATRHAKVHPRREHDPPGGQTSNGSLAGTSAASTILLSNESPILTITRWSLSHLNEQIKARGGKAAEASVFRANIVVAQDPRSRPGSEQPYAEDEWSLLRIGTQYYQMLGSCRRCQMVCIDQTTAEHNEEPFITLSKTRKLAGRVYFGQHTRHCVLSNAASAANGSAMIMVGDNVTPYGHGQTVDEITRAC